MDKFIHFKQVGYYPHDKQMEFHRSDARFKVFIGGRRTGKSTCSAHEMGADLMDKTKPGRMFWIVAPTYDLGSREFDIIWKSIMIKKQFLKQKHVRGSYNKKTGSMYIEMPWGSSIEVRSADHPENLVGAGLSGVIMAEAAKLKSDVWEQYIRGSLADYRGWASFTTTPEGHNWMYDMYLLGIDSKEEEYDSWHCPSWANNYLFPDGEESKEIQEMKRNMHPVRFDQEIGANFTSFVGKVYPMFNRDKHIKPHSYRSDWPNYLFIDFGYVNSCVFLDVQVSPRDEVYVWRERYFNDEILMHIIQSWKAMDHPKDYDINLAFGDASDPEGIETLNRYLCPAVAEPESKANWRQGVDIVGRFLNDREDGHPGLFVDPSCLNTIKEFMHYRMASPGRKTSDDPQEKPLKRDDHAMDAIRYGMMHLFELGMADELVVEEVGGSRGSGWNYRADTIDDIPLVSSGTGGYFRLDQRY